MLGVAFLGAASRQSEETHDVPTMKSATMCSSHHMSGGFVGAGIFLDTAVTDATPARK